jgi:acetyl-CoA carboxylase biotin carboxyl carrier protein
MAKKPSPAKGAKDDGSLPKLKAIYGFMTENNLDALELDEAGLHVKMVRRKAAVPAQVPVVIAGGAAAPQTAPAAVSNAPDALPPNCVTIKSSMMGIFYRAPTPSSPPFVKEGDPVKPGLVLCMIEAMKVFNEIKADFPCTVVKALLENGKPVKSGQDIFVVQRS